MRYPTSKAASDFGGKNSKEQPFPTTLWLETCKFHKMLLKFCISYTDHPSTTSGSSPVTAHQAEPARFNCPLPCSDSSEHQGSSWITTIGTSEFKPGKPAPSPTWNSLGNENYLFSPHNPLPGVTLRTTVAQENSPAWTPDAIQVNHRVTACWTPEQIAGTALWDKAQTLVILLLCRNLHFQAEIPHLVLANQSFSRQLKIIYFPKVEYNCGFLSF